MSITINDLARELNVTADDVTALVEQLVEIDGDEATIERVEELRNASGRVYGQEAWLTADAADTVREQVATTR